MADIRRKGRNVRFNSKIILKKIKEEGFKFSHFENYGIARSSLSTALKNGRCRFELLEDICKYLSMDVRVVIINDGIF